MLLLLITVTFLHDDDDNDDNDGPWSIEFTASPVVTVVALETPVVAPVAAAAAETIVVIGALEWWTFATEQLLLALTPLDVDVNRYFVHFTTSVWLQLTFESEFTVDVQLFTGWVDGECDDDDDDTDEEGTDDPMDVETLVAPLVDTVHPTPLELVELNMDDRCSSFKTAVNDISLDCVFRLCNNKLLIDLIKVTWQVNSYGDQANQFTSHGAFSSPFFFSSLSSGVFISISFSE